MKQTGPVASTGDGGKQSPVMRRTRCDFELRVRIAGAHMFLCKDSIWVPGLLRGLGVRQLTGGRVMERKRSNDCSSSQGRAR
jgi:hypothetical protein